MDTKRFVAAAAFATIAAAAMLALSACSGGGMTSPGGATAIDDVQSGTTPEGVDSELWATLSAELERVIEAEGTTRRTSAAPTGFGSRVPDLSVHEEGGQSIFTWSYRQHGDYDLNGVVTVSDLTQVGLHFGKTTMSDDWQQAQLADGDGNGEVNVSDVTPIGQNFGGNIDGYELQGRVDADSEFLLKADMAFTPGDKLAGLYPHYTHASALVPMGPEYRVVPYVENGSGREYGSESNIFRTLHNMDSHWHTRRGSNHRDGLSQAEGPVDNPLGWEVELEGRVLMQEPVVGADDQIYIGDFEDDSFTELAGYGNFYAISQQGEVNWRFRTKHGIAMTAATSRIGRVAIGDMGGIVYCLAPDGKQLWRRQLSGLMLMASPLMDDQGNVFIVTHTLSGDTLASSTIYKLQRDGTIDWSKPLSDTSLSTPFLNSQNEITAVDGSDELYSFDYDGVPTQNFMLPDSPLGGFPAFDIAIRGPIIVYSTNNNRLRFVLEDNSLTTFVDLTEENTSSPAVNLSNDIVVGTKTIAPDPVFKLNHYSGGTENWDMTIPGNFLGGIAVDPTDRMYIATFLADDIVPPGTNGISCILPDQTAAWFYPTDDRPAFSPVVADDNLLLCLIGGNIFTSEGATSLLGIRGS